MGMYTEFYFRANVKDGPVADWLDANINGDSDDSAWQSAGNGTHRATRSYRRGQGRTAALTEENA